MTVETSSELVRDQWSASHPNASWPTTVPAKAISPTYFFALEFLYRSPYCRPRTVVTEPMTYTG